MAPITMRCPVPECTYVSEEAEPAVCATLLTLHNNVHIAAAQQANIKKPDRPQVTQDMTETDWAEFVFNWTNYKRNSRIEGKADLIRAELQECCVKSVKSRLFMMKGNELTTIAENDLLEAIKTTCVEKVSVTVHRNRFHTTVQTQGENPQAFLSRLKAQASLCNFILVTKCSAACVKDTDTRNSYMDDAVSSQLIAGLANPDHRQKLLTEAATYPTLDDKMTLLDNLHTTENSENASESSTNVNKSEYSRMKTGGGLSKKCKCGKNIESKNEKHTFCKSCFDNAKTKKCECGFAILPTKSMCSKCARKSSKAKSDEKKADHNAMTVNQDTPESMSFSTSVEDSSQPDSSLDSHCTVSRDSSWNLDKEDETTEEEEEEDWSSDSSMHIVAVGKEEAKNQRSWGRGQAKNYKGPFIPHMEWSDSAEAFKPSRPLPQPLVKAKIMVLYDAMKAWRSSVGLETPGAKNYTKNSPEIRAEFEQSLADSGAQTSSIPVSICEKLGVDDSDYLPTEMNITGASGKGLDVAGAIMVRVTVGAAVSNQLMYIINNPVGPVLSRKALTDLGIIDKDFPRSKFSTNTSSAKKEVTECDCPAREKVPELPDKLPYEPTEENRGKLEDYIKDFFAKSAFNVCTHKRLAVRKCSFTLRRER